MANVTVFAAVDMSSTVLVPGTLTGATANQITITQNGLTDEYDGSFSYSGANVFGVVQAYSEYAYGSLAVRVTGLNMDAQTVEQLNLAGQVQALFQLALAGNDAVSAQYGHSTIFTYTGNDQIALGGGGNTVNAGAGLDMVSYSGSRSSYTISIPSSDTLQVGRIGQANDLLISVERVKFADAVLAFDTTGDAGQAYRLYQAAFNRTPDQTGVSFWTNSLDHGASLHDAAQAFVTSAEFQSIYGANPAPDQIVTRIYTNVLGRAPDASGQAYWVSQVQHGMSYADLLASFSESSENVAHVAPAISHGIVLDTGFF